MTSPVSAIEAIEKAMEGVTPGPWHDAPGTTTGRIVVAPNTTKARRRIAALGGPDREDNAAYIAACNPVAMREVLAVARQAEALQREKAELRRMLERCAPAERSKSWLPVPLWNDARALLGGSENAGN